VYGQSHDLSMISATSKSISLTNQNANKYLVTYNKSTNYDKYIWIQMSRRKLHCVPKNFPHITGSNSVMSSFLSPLESVRNLLQNLLIFSTTPSVCCCITNSNLLQIWRKMQPKCIDFYMYLFYCITFNYLLLSYLLL